MKKIVALTSLLLAVGLLAGMIGLVGCGKKQTTIETPEGKVEVTEEGEGKVTYRTKEGEATYESTLEEPSEAELGAPIYPDAEFNEKGSGKVSGTSAEGEYSATVAEFITDDSFDKVLSWYRGKLGEPLYVETTAREASWTKVENERIIAVSIQEEEGKVKIIISRTSAPLSP